MKYFARIEEDTVVNILTVADDVSDGQNFLAVDCGLGGVWVEIDKSGTATIGSTYDEINDKFISPKPFPSWTLDSDNVWQPPIPMPTDGGLYFWNEATQAWQ